MGINNIHILMNDDAARIDVQNAQRRMEAHIQSLVDAHRRGMHPYGSMRRDCPLCQKS
jgi:hypothetical protein